jgi:ATP-dependent Lon protease
MDEIEDFSESGRSRSRRINDADSDELPVLPLRDIVIYPFMIVPLFVSRDRSIKAVDEALEPESNDYARLAKRFGQGRADAGRFIQSRHGRRHYANAQTARRRIRILIQGFRAPRRFGNGGRRLRQSKMTPIPEPLAPENSLEVEALVRNVRGSMERAANLGKNISPEVLAIIANLEDAGRLADLSASNLELKVEDAQSVLDISIPSRVCAASTICSARKSTF